MYILNSAQKDVCKRIASHYGDNAQLHMVIEECLELSSVLHKSLTRTGLYTFSDRAIISEIADVLIVLEQCVPLFDQTMLKNEVTIKLTRQLNRINS